jgi:hypothetical protein
MYIFIAEITENTEKVLGFWICDFGLKRMQLAVQSKIENPKLNSRELRALRGESADS